MRTLSFSIVLFLLTTTSSFTFARAKKESYSAVEKKQAEKFYKKAETHFRFGEFEKAIVDLEKSYRFYPSPLVLFNIALCYQELKNYSEALGAYEDYLTKTPNPKNLKEINEKIKALKAAIKAEPKKQCETCREP